MGTAGSRRYGLNPQIGRPHCDINANNLLLDENLDMKFADFQGRYLSPDGTILLDGLSSENVKSSMPRSDPNYADQKTDIFALGSAICYMMTGHEPFPELDPFDDDDEAEIIARYRSGQFPGLDVHLGGHIVHNFWSGAYGSASEVVKALSLISLGCAIAHVPWPLIRGPNHILTYTNSLLKMNNSG
jgi:serine/threonine protein kinase